MLIFLALLVISIQLSDFYLMYIPFRRGMTHSERKNLLFGLLAWGIFSCIVSILVFENFGITAHVYKRLLIFGWIPYLIVFMLIVRRNILQHAFIFGMSRVWSIILHNFSAITTVLLFNTECEIIFSHAIIYLILFACSLPLEWRYFVKLLPPEKFFVDYGALVAFLPMIMTLGIILLWSQEPMIHSWQERFSRFYLPFVFFFFYRYILQTNEQLREQKRVEQNFKRMQEQLTVLKDYSRLIQDGRQKVAVMRHDLRHSYRLISVMLQNNELDAVKDYVDKQETLLGKINVKDFCQIPLVNAALSFYISRAENLGIKVRTKINLPENLPTEESDLALLISNLLENAINACSKQKFGEKIISVMIQSVESQCVLEILNSCGSAVHFDEKNYPQASTEGHGFGIASVKLFCEKYHAYTDFILEGDFFKVTMYWRI